MAHVNILHIRSHSALVAWLFPREGFRFGDRDMLAYPDPLGRLPRIRGCLAATHSVDDRRIHSVPKHEGTMFHQPLVIVLIS